MNFKNPTLPRSLVITFINLSAHTAQRGDNNRGTDSDIHVLDQGTVGCWKANVKSELTLKDLQQTPCLTLFR